MRRERAKRRVRYIGSNGKRKRCTWDGCPRDDSVNGNMCTTDIQVVRADTGAFVLDAVCSWLGIRVRVRVRVRIRVRVRVRG